MKVLLFGGNGFIGGQTAAQLLELGADVVAVNRGRSWDWDKRDTLKPRLRCITHNRKRPLLECAELVRLLHEWGSADAVIDFSGFDGRAVKQTAGALRDKTSLYVYISSDSVYEVCDKHHEGLTRETDAVRPDDPSIWRALKKRDSYGHKKLEGEEELKELRKSGSGPAYVILRLADVIGPEDGTGRWWQLQLWLKLAHLMHIPVLPLSLKHRMLSLVYVKDVAAAVVDILYMDTSRRMRIVDKEFNLAFCEPVTMEHLICHIEKKLALDGISDERIFDPSNNIPQIYPSVEKGPIDVTKARAMLSWNPTSCEDAVSETVEFYESVAKSSGYVAEKNECIAEMLDDIEGLCDTNKAEQTLRNLLFR